MILPFSKYEGLGNDFVVVTQHAAAQIEGSPEAWAPRLCDRHRGVGADGVLVIGAKGEQPSMTLWNADGSRGKNCGNGLRCVALHRARRGKGRVADWQTDAGPHRCEVKGVFLPGAEDERAEADVDVTMLPASFAAAEIPFLPPKGQSAPFLDGPLRIGNRTFQSSAVGMGNPHVVLFDVDADRQALGPEISKSRSFPEGVNVGFAYQQGGAFDLFVYERGAGWTEACGTGACACAAAAVATGRVTAGKPMAIRLPGGTLSITVNGPGEPIRMVGPARHVFDGAIALFELKTPMQIEAKVAQI